MVKEGRDFVKTIDYSTVLGEIQLSDEDIFLINKDRENILHAEEFSHELL
ncbi:hypothetical protein FACS189459_1620 [Bacilli bacterium]|nr:hypothetical protein FACS189459_1620 [Bacilli bacterium]